MTSLFKIFKNKIPQVLIIFLLLVIQAYCDLSLPSYTANIVDIGIQNTDISYIMNVGFFMLIMVSISVFATIGVSFFSSRISSGYAKDLRKVVYSKVLRFSNHELNKISRSSLITRSTNDINQIQNVLVMILMVFFFAPIMGIGSIIKVFEIGGNLSWIILVTFLVVLILLITVTMRVLPYFKLSQELLDKMNKTVREILIGMPVIKAFVRQDYEQKKFGKINKEYLDIDLYIFRKVFILMPSMTLFLNLMIVLILYFGAYDAIAGNILTGDIIAFIQYSTHLVFSFIMVAGIMVVLPRFLVSTRRVSEILNMELSLTDGEITSIADNPVIEFKNVSYLYPGSEKEILKDINFKLVPGKTTAIIGGTGSGKSTILNLIPRLQDVTSGEILINNENIKNFNLKTLRDKISYTPQRAILFQGTVKSNIQTGKNDATDEEIENALKLAQVDFIKDIDDEVSQGGSNFSGGQKQRLSIARAIIGAYDFYLFDDCFSALDMNTEAIIKNNLYKLSKNASILLVSQRISTIMDADEIIVLDDGKIIDKGSHNDLINRCDVYSEIASSQMEDSLCLQ
jgi:ATP-binding cassette subfamily B protein